VSWQEVFTFHAPANLTFGPGALAKLPDLVAGFGPRAVVVSDPGVAKAGILPRVLSLLTEAGIAAEPFTDVEANPSVETVNATMDRFRRTRASFVIGAGGGSAMDVAKVVGVLGGHGGGVHDYEGVGKVPGPGIPVVAIPTTAGTGSEVTIFSVITDRERRFKMTVGSPHIVPQVALCDPDLTVSMPPALTAATGMDALTHAIESFINTAHNPIASALALEAIRRIGRSLRAAYANGADRQARTEMLLASTMAAMAFSRTRLGNVHAMSHPIGAHYDVPHGVANAVLLPYVMEWNLMACYETYPAVAAALGEPVDGVPRRAAAAAAVDAVRALARDVQIPPRLRDVGVAREGIPAMTDDAMKSGNVLVNPRRTTGADIAALFEMAY
jgi:alcohol dehydrogenase class IV